MSRSVSLICLILSTSAFSGCHALDGKPRMYGVAKVGTPARHNIDAQAGVKAVWRSGAECEVLGGRRLRVEEPSTRGMSEETLIDSKVTIPLGR